MGRNNFMLRHDPWRRHAFSGHFLPCHPAAQVRLPAPDPAHYNACPTRFSKELIIVVLAHDYDCRQTFDTPRPRDTVNNCLLAVSSSSGRGNLAEPGGKK